MDCLTRDTSTGVAAPTPALAAVTSTIKFGWASNIMEYMPLASVIAFLIQMFGMLYIPGTAIA
jgi:hypothetical protein